MYVLTSARAASGCGCGSSCGDRRHRRRGLGDDSAVPPPPSTSALTKLPTARGAMNQVVNAFPPTVVLPPQGGSTWNDIKGWLRKESISGVTNGMLTAGCGLLVLLAAATSRPRR